MTRVVVHFDAGERLLRRVKKSDIGKKRDDPNERGVKPSSLRLQISVFRESMTTLEDVKASDAQRDGVAAITAGQVIGRVLGSVRAVCAHEPNKNGPCGPAHSLVAVVAEGTGGVNDDDVGLLIADLADDFQLPSPPQK